MPASRGPAPWEDDPNVYGVRRSGRAAKVNYNEDAMFDDDDDDSDAGPSRARASSSRLRGANRRRKNSEEDFIVDDDEEEEEDELDDDDEPEFEMPLLTSGRRAAARAVQNFREDSGDDFDDFDDYASPAPRRNTAARRAATRKPVIVDSDDDYGSGGGGGGGRPRSGRRKQQIASDDDEFGDFDETEDELDDSVSFDDEDDDFAPQRRGASRTPKKKKGKKKGKKSSSRNQSSGGYDNLNDSVASTGDDFSGINAKLQRRKAMALKAKLADVENSSEDEDLMDEDEIRMRRERKAQLKQQAYYAGAQTEEEAEPEPTIDRVCQTSQDFRDYVGDDDKYMIKWKGKSHVHNTWHTKLELDNVGVKGMKKLDNFIQRHNSDAYNIQHVSREEADAILCDKEMDQDMLDEFTIVERVIAVRERRADRPNDPPEATMVTEYMVKWQGVPYGESTWEREDWCTEHCADQIDLLLQRNNNPNVPKKSIPHKMHRPRFNEIKEQPSFLGSDELRLRSYQLDGLNYLVYSWTVSNSCILADEMGLGKTIQTISFLSYLFHAFNLHGPFLVVVPLSTLMAWQRECARWAPAMNTIVLLGDEKSRDMIVDYEFFQDDGKTLKFNCMLTTYEMVLKCHEMLLDIPWAVLMVDEAHRLKNAESSLYKALTSLRTYHRLLITGTPLQNSMKELWALLAFLMPRKFGSWEEFEAEHGNLSDQTHVQNLHSVLQPYMMRRVKKDVEKSLPPKVERILRVEMSGLQKQLYQWILTRNYSMLSSKLKGSKASFVNVVMELKKCCNHPFLTTQEYQDLEAASLDDLIRTAGKMFLLDKLLTRLKEQGHRVLIFSQMVMMLDVLGEYLRKRGFKFQRLDGGTGRDRRRMAMDHFNAPGSEDFCFLLSTRAGGLGINLATADTVIIFDSDWNPQNDLQAEARAHRIGQKNVVSIYRLMTKDTVEENILKKAKEKMLLDHLVIQRMDTSGRVVSGGENKSKVPFSKDELNKLLKFGASNMFAGAENDDDEDDGKPPGSGPIKDKSKLEDIDLDAILDRAEVSEDAEKTTAGDQFLNQFKVTEFSAAELEKDWDQIIPKKQREKIEREEEEKRLKEMNLGRRRVKPVMTYTEEFGDETDSKGTTRSKKERNKRGGGSAAESGDDVSTKRRRREPAAGGEGCHGMDATDLRRFERALRKFGSSPERRDEVLRDAQLDDLNLDGATLDKIVSTLTTAARTAIKEREEEDKNKPKEDKDQKAVRRPVVTAQVGDVKFNAEEFSERQEQMAFLQSLFAGMQEPTKYRIKRQVKAAQFRNQCIKTWSIVEDSMLLYAVWRHGLSNWDAVKRDTAAIPNLPEIILPNEEQRARGFISPTAIQLDRRAINLINIVMERSPGAGTGALGGTSRLERNQKAAARKQRAAAAAAAGGGMSADSANRAGGAHLAGSGSAPEAPAEVMACKADLRPLRDELRACRDFVAEIGTHPEKHPDKTANRQRLLNFVKIFGDHIETKATEKADSATAKMNMWKFVEIFLDMGMSWEKLQARYERQKGQHSGPDHHSHHHDAKPAHHGHHQDDTKVTHHGMYRHDAAASKAEDVKPKVEFVPGTKPPAEMPAMKVGDDDDVKPKIEQDTANGHA
eukprot:Clim_evm8s183 gene=Clim_evmTU8s183